MSPDITMCKGHGCPIKESCKRFKAKPSEFKQSYFAKVPYDHKNLECAEYWPFRPINSPPESGVKE